MIAVVAIVAWKPGLLPGSFRARVVHAFDGDTISVRPCPVRSVVRVYGIDAPEWGQAGALEAQRALLALARSGQLLVEPLQLDRFGRIVARLHAFPVGDVGLELLRHGLVWWEHRFAPDAHLYREAQRVARLAKIGLWRTTPYAFAPWVHRSRTRGQ